MVVEFDGKVELKFLDEKIVKLQKDLLEMENDGLPDAEQLVISLKDAIARRRKQLEDFKVKRIRLVAEIQYSSHKMIHTVSYEKLELRSRVSF